jgi:hypothetical protein
MAEMSDQLMGWASNIDVPERVNWSVTRIRVYLVIRRGSPVVMASKKVYSSIKSFPE